MITTKKVTGTTLGVNQELSKGVDIFGKKDTSVSGFTFATGKGKHSGKYIIILGPKLRLHFYAHLNSVSTNVGKWHSLGEKKGTL